MSTHTYRAASWGLIALLTLMLLGEILADSDADQAAKVTFVANIATAVATGGLLYCAWLALRQISIMEIEGKRQETRDKALAISKQVGFFRREVLELSGEVNKQLEEVKSAIVAAGANDFQYCSIEQIEEFTVSWMLNERPKDTLTQQIFWQTADTYYGKGTYGQSVQRVLNALEELAIDIRANDTVHDDYLRSIRLPFVALIETLAWPMVFTGPYNPDMYPGIRYVYDEWRKSVARMQNEDLKARVGNDIRDAAQKLRSAVSKAEYESLRAAVDKVKRKSTSSMPSRS